MDKVSNDKQSNTKLDDMNQKDVNDQQTDTSTTSGPHQVIEQAGRDIKHGLRDSEARGIPSDVPGPHEEADQSQGTQVPPDGISRTC